MLLQKNKDDLCKKMQQNQEDKEEPKYAQLHIQK